MRSTCAFAIAVLCSTPLMGQEGPATPAATAAETNYQVRELEQRLRISEKKLQELHADSTAQLQRLTQENQRLRRQLKAQEVQTPKALLSESQRWFALGAGVSLGSLLVGALLRGKRRPQTQWTN